MFDSLQRVLGALPAETILYPGHDYGDIAVSSLAREREHNPYFQLGMLERFVAHRNRPREGEEHVRRVVCSASTS